MKKGFTLLELLVVIGILAILTTVVAFTLNPAQLLAQARDSQRLSDLNSVSSAVSLFLATASTTTSMITTSTCTVGTTSPFTSACVNNSSTTVSGNGWVRVDLTAIPSGSPLSKLPIDPTNNSTYFYAYAGDGTNFTFELNANLESTKYASLETTDGGNNTSYYEVGSDPDLNL